MVIDQHIYKCGNDSQCSAESITYKCILDVEDERAGLWGCWEDMLKATLGKKPSSEIRGAVEKQR